MISIDIFLLCVTRNDKLFKEQIKGDYQCRLLIFLPCVSNIFEQKYLASNY